MYKIKNKNVKAGVFLLSNVYPVAGTNSQSIMLLYIIIVLWRRSRRDSYGGGRGEILRLEH
jgi:hypothetical protein